MNGEGVRGMGPSSTLGSSFALRESSLGSGDARGRLDGIRAQAGFLRLALDVVGCRAMVESATSGAKPDIGLGPE